MSKLQITGGTPLEGCITISGAKNSLLPIMSACLMVRGSVILHHVPRLSDLSKMLHIMAQLGCHVHQRGDTVKIEVNELLTHEIRNDDAKKIRGSIFIMGALLARCQAVKLPYPGGCAIGSRPIDLHLDLLRQVGAKIKVTPENICGTYHPKRHRYKQILTLDFPSVGATENIIQATALGVPGNIYEIYGVAKEPEIVDLCQFLNACGAKISGAGTDVIIVESVNNLHGTTYTPIPDRINTGSYMIATVAVGGTVTLKNTIPEHNLNLIKKLRAVGAKITCQKDTIEIIAKKRKRQHFDLHTAPYPGFPTDLQSQFAVLATLTPGQTVITENLFENRFRYVPELRKLGAQITLDGHKAVIRGGKSLTAQTTPPICPCVSHLPDPADCLGTVLTATDLRGGVALVIAGLATQGTTTIEHAEYIDRGHENIVKDFRQLGANIAVLVE